MRQIAPYPLWTGHTGEGRDFAQVFALGIQAVIDLAREEAPAPPPRELIYVRVPLVDGAGNPAKLLSLAVHTAAALFRMHVPTLIVCGGGMSRAPSIAAAALAVALEEPPEACLRKVTANAPHDVAPGFWQDLVAVLENPSALASE
jgi:hypothetical protein